MAFRASCPNVDNALETAARCACRPLAWAGMRRDFGLEDESPLCGITKIGFPWEGNYGRDFLFLREQYDIGRQADHSKLIEDIFCG